MTLAFVSFQKFSFSFEERDFGEMGRASPRSPGSSSRLSAARLELHSVEVCSQILPIPEGVNVCFGHLFFISAFAEVLFS